jgi:hypothetical protein
MKNILNIGQSFAQLTIPASSLRSSAFGTLRQTTGATSGMV